MQSKEKTERYISFYNEIYQSLLRGNTTYNTPSNEQASDSNFLEAWEQAYADFNNRVEEEALLNLSETICETLYDPCTKEPIPDIATLEKRVRELKKQANTTPVGLYGLTSKTSNFDFLTNVFINKSISLDDMVSFKLGEGRQAGSDIYEVLCRLFVYFGGIEGVSLRDDGNFALMKRIEGGATEVYKNATEALKKMECLASRKMGLSDITLRRTKVGGKSVDISAPYCESECDTLDATEVKTYLMSVKWYKNEKNAEHYDLEKLFTAAERIVGTEQKPVSIIVFLKSKRDFEIAHNRAFRQYVRELSNTFFGWNEDVKPFLQEIRRSIFEQAELNGITPLEALQSQYFTATAKPILSLQLHQDIIVSGICDSLETTEDFLYLIGVLPRGGKTYIAGGILREYLKRNSIENLNVFWITAAPTETKSQVQKDLIEKFQDFEDFEFIEAKAESSLNKTKKHTVIFISSQLLIAARKTSSKKKRDFLLDLVNGREKIGLVFFDEAHKTGKGVETKQQIDYIINSYAMQKLPLIFLTATYYNIIFEYNIQKANTFIWDYTDVLSSRALDTESEQENALQNLKKRFGEELVSKILERRLSNGERLETMAKAYIGFPDLYFLSADFQQEAISRFEAQNVYRPDSGFSLSTIFALQPGARLRDIKQGNKIRKDAYRQFLNLVNPRNLVSLITPQLSFTEAGEGGEPLVKEEGPSIEPTILGRIDKISRDSNSRFRLDENPTLLMFLPTGGQGSNIFILQAAWASLLMNHSWWASKYEIACVVADQNLTADNIAAQVGLADIGSDTIHIISDNYKSKIIALERKLQCEKNKGLVILAGETLSMGISLPCTDVVFLFSEKKSPDDIIQKMYRALTPSEGKKSAFVVDLNPVRSLAAIYGYTRASHQETNTKSELLDIIYDSYTWDADYFELNMKKGANARPLTFQQRLDQLFDAAEADRSGEYKINEDMGGFEKKLAENIRKQILESDSSFLKKIHSQFSGEKLSKALSTLGLRNNTKISLERGKLVVRIRIPKEAENDENEPTYEEQEFSVENFIETVADFVKYLAITSSKATLDEALEEFESNLSNNLGTSLRSNVLRLIKARTVIKGNDDTLLLKLLVLAVKDFAHSSSERIFRQMKGKIEEKSVRKNAVLKIIHKHLTPRQKQKKDFGEVFTPVELIEDMLSHLPKSVWSNPELKWLDPANGIGNFPVVAFYKLDEGLKSWEPNERKRRKHIVENMLYMIEIQSGNTRIARNIFKKLCDCEPNILTTDSLKVTNEKLTSKHFPLTYDVIIGNPPFQAFQEAEGKRGGGDELYMKFVKKSLELLKPNGHLVFVHPPSWRKPEYSEGRKKSKNAGMFDLMAHDNQIEYLEIHNADDGMRVFKAATRYDFYCMKKATASKETIIKDMVGNISKVDLRDFEFLPNFNIPNILKLFPKKSDTKCDLGQFNESTGKYDNIPCILYEASKYETRKSWVSSEKKGEFKYPLIHSTPQTGPRYMYSSTNKKGFFGIPKVIFGDSGINEPILDIDGTYGMTQHAMGIAIKNESDGKKLASFLKSNFFTNILLSCMWSGFQIDWRLFTYFKSGFWNIHVDLDEEVINSSNEETAGGSYKQKRFNKTRKIHRS